MKIVLDTSIIIAILMNESDKQGIIKATKGAEIFAPASFPWEIGNAFSAMFKRKRISLTQAQQAFKIYEMIPIQLVDISISDAMKTSNEYNIHAYDAYILECAKKLHYPLMSLDEQLIVKANQMKIKVIELKKEK